MNRRTFMRSLSVGLTAAGGVGLATLVHKMDLRLWPRSRSDDGDPTPESDAISKVLALDPVADEGALAPRQSHHSRAVEKSQDFDRVYHDDFLMPAEHLPLLRQVSAKLERAQVLIGHGHFNLVGYENLLRYARRYPKIGRFAPDELDLLEEIFFADATRYGFFGKKVNTELTATVAERDVVKVPGSGHYLLRGESLDKFIKVKRDLGDTILLTSGVRGLVKQFQLFLGKAVRTKGNMSQAARQLAPPGHSYHAIGDFDLGKVGLGPNNFTKSFAETREYETLIELGYVNMRYNERNPFGVRHEPWHIKINHSV